MAKSHWLRLLVFVGAVSCGACVVIAQQASESNRSDQLEVLVQPETDKTLLNDVDENRVIVGEEIRVERGRWIGVGIGPVPEVLRAHLNVPDGVGLIVEQVVPDSPATRAGMKRHDVILAVNGKQVSQPTDLIEAVQSDDDGTIELEWQRGGQRMTAKLTTVERPESLELGRRIPVTPPEGDTDDFGRLRDWVDRLEQGRTKLRAPLRLKVLTPDANRGEMPSNLRIQVEKEGNDPARVTVKKNDSTWELTENDLDQLPDDVRPHVERMLGGGTELDLRGLNELDIEGLPLFDGRDILRRRTMPLPGFERQLEEMNRRMDEMFKELQKLRMDDGLKGPKFEPGEEA